MFCSFCEYCLQFIIVLVEELFVKLEILLFEMLILLSLFEFIDLDFWFCFFVVKLISFLLFCLGYIVIENEVEED